jgi:precorrin-8X/cobalt-precorrin-8 methylmutase
MTPAEIEALSFKIIDQEAGRHDFSSDQWTIVRRMIHTSADFEYLETVRFHPNAVAAGLDAIRNARTIVTDTNMAKVGIRTGDLQRFGVQVKCYITDPVVVQKAAAEGTTRAKAAVDAALSEIRAGIYVVGNAPTALLHLTDLVKVRQAAPALIVGLPVGFVNAAESKAALLELDCPYITNVGRKGGSNVAASVVNALVKLAMAGTE